MPSIQATLRDALGNDPTLTELLGGHIYPGEVPDDSDEPPWLYYAVPESAPFDELDNNGNQDLTASVEFHAFAPDYATAKAIIDQVQVVLDTYQGGQISAAFWRGTTETVEDEGHHHTARYDVWGSLAFTLAEAGTRARIVMGADSIALVGGSHTFSVTSDGFYFDSVSWTQFARRDQANTFSTGLQLIQGSISCPASSSGSFPGEKFGAGAGAAVVGGTVGNTLIGQTAGASISSGSNNTVVGFQAGTGLTTGIDNTIIGSQLTVPSAINGGTAVGRSLNITGTSKVCVVGNSNTVAHNSVIALGTLADSTKDGQFVTGRDIIAWTMSHLSSTTTRPCAELQRAWADSTDATRAGRLLLGAYSTTTYQEGVRVDANSGGVRIGFYGGAAVAKQTVTGAKGGNAALGSLLTALANLGLVIDSTTA